MGSTELPSQGRVVRCGYTRQSEAMVASSIPSPPASNDSDRESRVSAGEASSNYAPMIGEQCDERREQLFLGGQDEDVPSSVGSFYPDAMNPLHEETASSAFLLDIPGPTDSLHSPCDPMDVDSEEPVQQVEDDDELDRDALGSTDDEATTEYVEVIDRFPDPPSPRGRKGRGYVSQLRLPGQTNVRGNHQKTPGGNRRKSNLSSQSVESSDKSGNVSDDSVILVEESDIENAERWKVCSMEKKIAIKVESETSAVTVSCLLRNSGSHLRLITALN